MTDLMKQREEEKEILKSDMTVTVPAFIVNEYNQLKLENITLKEQLRWRPVSEKPEQSGLYFAEVRPYTGNMDDIVTTAYFNGERFPFHNVVRWLPIPPESELLGGK
jgi:hypothetical protein